MSCICWPRRSEGKPYFHWPNFTFSHSQHAINARRRHSTFSLTRKHKPKRHLRRRHTLHNGTIVSKLEKPKKSHSSLHSTKTAPPVVVNAYGTMSDEQHNVSPPTGPPPGYHDESQNASPGQHVSWAQPGGSGSELACNNPFHRAHMNASQEPLRSDEPPPECHAPPGPPPSLTADKKESGPSNEDYAPPPGPPPTHQSKEPEPPPYDPWLSIPDNALLPPPPSIREERSPTANASSDDASRAHEWCRQNRLWPPRRHTQQTLTRIAQGDIYLTTPPNSKDVQLTRSGTGTTHIKTSPNTPDTSFLSDIPLYPATAGRPRTIYYELRVTSMGTSSRGETEAGISIGFLAPPYPPFRLPGWHRASLAVHGDDGRRYIDNSYGGQAFTSPFRKNDIVGIGMSFSPPNFVGGRNRCEVFFTRNGKREGGWDLHEERDREQVEGEVHGLEGEHDLLAAVGCFGMVEFEAVMARDRWLYKPVL